MSRIKHIFYLAAAVIPMAAAVSCSKMAGTEDGSAHFFVRGRVYSTSDLSPINGIQVIVSSFESTDVDKAAAIEKDTVYTNGKGEYFSVIDKAGFYDIVATDIDGADNGGNFTTSSIDMIIAHKKGLDNQDLYMN